MSERKLDFTKGKVEVLTLDELKQTHRENYPDGNPVGDIYHFDLLYYIADLLEKRNIPYEFKEIFAVNNKMRGRNGVSISDESKEIHGEGSLESFILRRVFANIALFGDDHHDELTDSRYNLAVSYTQQGIMVGFGPYVFACHNQTICAAQHIVSNYSLPGCGRMEFRDRELPAFLNRLTATVDQVIPSYEADMKESRSMQNVVMTQVEVEQFIGALDAKRVLCDSQDKDIHSQECYPLGDKNIHALIENLHKKRMWKGCTMYQLMQEANFFCKPGHTLFNLALPQSLMLFNGMKSYHQTGIFDFSINSSNE